MASFAKDELLIINLSPFPTTPSLQKPQHFIHMMYLFKINMLHFVLHRFMCPGSVIGNVYAMTANSQHR